MKSHRFIPLLAALVFGVAHSAVAGMSGFYRVIPADRTERASLVLVRATNSVFQFRKESAYSRGTFVPVYGYQDFQVGARKELCVSDPTDNCFSVYTGTYSRNGTRFTILEQHSENRSPLGFVREIEFTQLGDELQVVVRTRAKTNAYRLRKVSR